MNKLLLSKVIEIKENGVYFLEILKFSDSFSINVFPHVNAKILLLTNCFDGNVEINILEEAKLSLETFGVSSNFSYEVHLKDYGASFDFVYSGLTNSSEFFKMNLYHDALNTNSKVVNHIVHYGYRTTILQVDGYIPKGCCGSKMIQDNKIILMDDGKGKILPNLYISEFDSFSEHSAYISKFSKEQLFYLQMRGIDDKSAANLLKRAFLLGGFSLIEDISELKNIKGQLVDIVQQFGGDEFVSR